MSMPRSILKELCDYVQQKPSNVLGNKFFDCRVALHVDLSQKGDKFESRILAISKFRLFLLTGKSPSLLKVERSFHLLAIKTLQIIKDDEVSLTYDDAAHKRRIIIRSSYISGSELIKHIFSAFKRYFPDIGAQLKNIFELSPKSLYTEFINMAGDVTPRACHSFRRTYAALCDFYDQPYREEVSWDVEKIYTINKIKMLRVEDFSHLLPKDLLPITGVLQYSAYFTGLVVDGIRIPPDLMDVILSAIRKSQYLTHIQLRNCALPRDFITLFASALQNNNLLPIESIDLSRNVLDDKKGFTVLSSILPRITSLRSVNMSECGLADKCMQLFCAGIYSGLTASKTNGSSLTYLNLASNPIKEDVSSLVNLVSLCTSLRVLDLSDTAFPLDKLWPALKYGGLQIERLMLGGCLCGKKPSESAQSVKEFFSMAVNLTHISFANTSLPPELMKAMLLGLASNQQLKPFELDLDGTCEKGSAAVLEACLGGVRFSSISLRDNNLEAEMQGVVHALCSVSTLRKVNLGGANLAVLRRSSKQVHGNIINKILLDIVKLYADDSALEELILSDARLGAHLSVLLNTLGAASTLRVLDISSNEMSNFGARILSKALQLNVSLRTVIIDNNHIGADGFSDLATAVSMNHTLTSIPYPVHDVCECMQRTERSRVLTAVAQIEAALERNRSADNADAANYRRVLGGKLQTLLDKGDLDVSKQVENELSAAKDEIFPPRIEELVDDFVEQIRRESVLAIRDSLSFLSGLSVDGCGDAPIRAERIAADRLKELWLKDVKNVLSDWRWQELCERSELALRSVANCVSRTPLDESPNQPSPRMVKRSVDSGHRPRSIIGELHSPYNQEMDVGISMDLPPQPSALTHIQKSRPRMQRKGVSGLHQVSVDDLMVMSRSTDLDEDVQSTKSEDSEKGETKKSLSNRLVFRPAMLPDAALLSSVQLRPALDRASSPKSDPFPSNLGSPTINRIDRETESPPPLPHRNRSGNPIPPMLPPKPAPRNALPTMVPVLDESDENANSRRSVADMARIFNR